MPPPRPTVFAQGRTLERRGVAMAPRWPAVAGPAAPVAYRTPAQQQMALWRRLVEQQQEAARRQPLARQPVLQPRPAPPQLTPTTPSREVNAMAETLRAKGVVIAPQVLHAVAASRERQAALQAKDFRGGLTAFQHIVRIADARVLADGTPSAPLAADLFDRVGHSLRVPVFGRCYARTSHAIFAKHHAGEYARLLGDLATTGRTTLAGGAVIRWTPQTLRVPAGQHVDYLWSSLNHLASNRDHFNRGVLNSVASYASHGQMANIFTRLTGRRHVNVSGVSALPHLNAIIARHGPMLAEYGAHGGSVAQVVGNLPQSLEAGSAGLRPYANLGYVVVPESEAKRLSLAILQYPNGNTGYLPAGR